MEDGDKIVPVVVDTEGTQIKDTDTPVYSGSKVKLAFFQKPYILPSWRHWYITETKSSSNC